MDFESIGKNFPYQLFQTNHQRSSKFSVQLHRARLNELIHLIGFIDCAVLVTSKFALDSLTLFWLIIALALNLILCLWPVEASLGAVRDCGWMTGNPQ